MTAAAGPTLETERLRLLEAKGPGTSRSLGTVVVVSVSICPTSQLCEQSSLVCGRRETERPAASVRALLCSPDRTGCA